MSFRRCACAARLVPRAVLLALSVRALAACLPRAVRVASCSVPWFFLVLRERSRAFPTSVRVRARLRSVFYVAFVRSLRSASTFVATDVIVLSVSFIASPSVSYRTLYSFIVRS